MVSLLDTLAASAAEAVLQRLLDLDPVARAEADQLAGRSAIIETTLPPLRLQVLFSTGRVLVSAAGLDPMDRAATASDPEVEPDEADVSIRITPRGMVDVLAGDAERSSLSDDLQIHGDRSLAEALMSMAQHLRPDLEAPLARIFGDVGARGFGNAVRQTGAAARAAAGAAAAAGHRHLTAAQGPLPERGEVLRFLDDVDDLRVDVDRMEARIQQLLRARDGAST